MFHALHDWTAEAVPVARLGGARAQPGEPFSLVVDLGADLLSPRWWRGAATLALLCASAAMLAPGIEPLPAGARTAPTRAEQTQAEALAIAPLSSGAHTGLQMAPSELVEPLTHAPERARIELFLTADSSGSLTRLLQRAGASGGDSVVAAALVASAVRVQPGTTVAILLGERTGGGARRIERVTLRGGLGETLVVERGGAGLELIRRQAPVDTRPLRIRGQVGDGFYWSLRSAGVSPEAAADYLRAIGSRIDVGGEVMPTDRFELVIANRRAATGEAQAGPLLYAGLDRAGSGDLQLLRWTVDGRTGWFDANGSEEAEESAMARPVSGPVTSGFGYRVHPILRFKRLHRGVDFGAAWGSPIVAAADGRVMSAGWAGGYGRQVRIAHGDGIASSYSHMSRIAVDDGTLVRRGQLIGFVGSSGLSTGPHLHYEVYRNGQAVNPLSVRLAGGPLLSDAQRDAIRARVKALLGAR